MIIHSVYFWLKADLPDQQRQEFEQELSKLTHIRSVSDCRFGVPSSTDRPVIERSYDYGLIITFDSLAKHDVYQDDPVHRQFIENCRHLWRDVKIYDVEI